MSNTDEKEKLKILIVDDSEYNRTTMSKILTEANYNVVGMAGSAEDAIQITHSSKPDIIFIDIVMPNVSGLELAKHLQEKQKSARYIVMMSSLNLESVVIESISNGAIDFLQKPFDKNDLLMTVEKIERMVETTVS